MILDKYRFLNIEKIVQIFFYIQKHTNTDSKLELIKLLFFSDKIHIREYFSFISIDKYVALENGPAASVSLSLLNKKINRKNYHPHEIKYFDNIINRDKKIIINKVQSDLLSRNEMNSLDKAINLFFGKNLTYISHDYPEWKRFKDLFEKEKIKKCDININDFFTNPDLNDSPALFEYFDGIDPLYKDIEYLEEAKQFYLESAAQYAT
jgi:hypothetical protein